MRIYEDKFAHYTTALLMALAAKSNETGNHAKRVAKISLAIGRELQLDQEQLEDLKYGALLHDVGKIETPEHILHKTDRLTEEETLIMRRHPNAGAAILGALGFPSQIWEIPAQHHENFDGSGYPFGRAGANISIGARVFAVADTYDAITSDRCYRKAQSPEVGQHEIAAWSGRQFDPQVVDAFLACKDRL